MEVKFGKIKPNNNLFIVSQPKGRDDNFFASNQEKQQENNQKQSSGSNGRINDYDSTILENNAYKAIPDEMFQIEHKIGILEDTLAKINSEIETLESFGYAIQVSALRDRKQKIEDAINELNEEYEKLGLSAKLSGHIASAIGFTSKKKRGIFSFFKLLFPKKFLTKISKKFNFNQFMKEALTNLSCINSSVDELINMQTPYGETISRYEKLTAYLNKANVIHAQIYRNVNSAADKLPPPKVAKNKLKRPTLPEIQQIESENIKPKIHVPQPVNIKGKL